MVKSVTVRAPCSTANLGPGFDVFGMALDAFYDEVTVTKIHGDIKLTMAGGVEIVSSDNTPLDPKKNTAGIVAKNMLDRMNLSDIGLQISIKKNVPPGYGLGSSAASAAACAIAIKRIFSNEHPHANMIFDDDMLLEFAGSGEKASAGTVHYDNVAASLFGGFVVVNPYAKPHNGIVHHVLPIPSSLEVVVAIPKINVPKQKTKASRGVLPKNVKFSDATQNLAFATSMIAELGQGKKANAVLFARKINDVIVEPARKKMIPGFDTVKSNALGAGAVACTISGAGPSVIAFTSDAWAESRKKRIAAGMKKGFKSAKVDCDIIICKPSKGPKIVKVVK